MEHTLKSPAIRDGHNYLLDSLDMEEAAHPPHSNEVGRTRGKLNGWSVGPGDISSWSSFLSNEARRLELHGMEADKDSIVLLRQLATQVRLLWWSFPLS
jgi:hypothetical protein